MKLVTFTKNSYISCGVLTDRGIVNLTPQLLQTDSPVSIKQIIAQGPECLKKVHTITAKSTAFINPAAVEFLAPIPAPGKILALAGNYAKHIIEAGLKLGLTASPRKNTVPRPFLKPNTVINNPDGIIPWPAYSKEIDYEIELAVVIGKEAKCISPQNAKEYIAGYTIANDVSARSVTFKQGREKRPWDEFYDWLNGKWADGFLPLGPCIVTADEIEDPQNLQMVLKVNGEIRQNANTADMIFGVYEIVSFLSYITTLEPGDIIATGTPEGVAMATGNFLKAGDEIECAIEKIGTLTNTLGKKPEKFYEPLI
ncbi:MAG: fumarylacetoacetate hydrolase family protein [Phycisphaerae bacterium]|jgi:2-keto-4-pentenoate hydratase/2-oxohepta-3-ene-1,7-dioic acid hydratase in catechol pathway